MSRRGAKDLVALLFAGVTLLLVCGQTAGAQQSTATIHVQVRAAGRPVEGALVRSGAAATQTDADGTAIIGVPAGRAQVTVARLGFFPDSIAVTLAVGADTTLLFELRSAAAVIAAVVVTSTRAERRLEEEPLRVEVLAGEDVAEKSKMRPADLRALFREMSGVRVQTTSAALGAATVRVQGLRGRYSLVLNDGLPLFGAHPTGFGLVQQPPLDLRQVEVIKGAASALYGPAALGGVVNLISRRPPDSSQVLLNQTARAGTDLLGFVARPLSSHLGLTVLGGAHYQRSGDVDRDGWNEIPGFGRVELRQRLFYEASAGRSLMVTAGGFAEQRGGGALSGRAAGGSMASADSLGTQHGDVGAVGHWRVAERCSVAVRAAANLQTRQRQFARALEREQQQTLFGEFTATGVAARHDDADRWRLAAGRLSKSGCIALR